MYKTCFFVFFFPLFSGCQNRDYTCPDFYNVTEKGRHVLNFKCGQYEQKIIAGM